MEPQQNVIRKMLTVKLDKDGALGRSSSDRQFDSAREKRSHHRAPESDRNRPPTEDKFLFLLPPTSLPESSSSSSMMGFGAASSSTRESATSRHWAYIREKQRSQQQQQQQNQRCPGAQQSTSGAKSRYKVEGPSQQHYHSSQSLYQPPHRKQRHSNSLPLQQQQLMERPYSPSATAAAAVAARSRARRSPPPVQRHVTSDNSVFTITFDPDYYDRCYRQKQRQPDLAPVSSATASASCSNSRAVKPPQTSSASPSSGSGKRKRRPPRRRGGDRLCPRNQQRPDPEGAPSTPEKAELLATASCGGWASSHDNRRDSAASDLAYLLNKDPLFSDYGSCSDSDTASTMSTDSRGQVDEKGVILRGFTAANLNSSTMIKFSIIGAEIQNMITQSLRKAETEVQSLSRRIQLLEDELEQTEGRLHETNQKLQEASTAAEESERLNRRSSRLLPNETLAQQPLLGELDAATGGDNYRFDFADSKVLELEEALRAAGIELRSREISQQLATSCRLRGATSAQKEETHENLIMDLTMKLKEAEERAETAEREVASRQKEIEETEEKLQQKKDNLGKLKADLEQYYKDIESI